jgi:multidrug resistance protein, MATE family
MEQPLTAADGAVTSASVSYRAVIALAGPMILAMTGEMLMQLVDGVFLSRYSVDAVAALGPAGLAGWGLRSFFIGTVGYVSTFVAQYHGAGRPQRIGPAVWQAAYLAIAAGLLIAALSGESHDLVRVAGHHGKVGELEATYFGIVCMGAPVGLLDAALSGYLSGIGRTSALMAVQLSGQVLHAGVAYALVFGAFGLPRMGIAGAAWSIAAGHTLVCLLLAGLFLAPSARRLHGSWSGRRPDLAFARRLLRFGLPNGARFFFEMLSWTLFLVFIGRIGDVELAASSIAFRINGVAFFPVIGISMAVGILVGQAQGAGRPDLARRATWRGLVVTQIWMVSASILFVALPRQLFGLFHDPAAASPERWGSVVTVGTMLLRFVALYGLVDGFNVVFMGALQGAGDTRFSLRAILAANAVFAGALAVLDARHAGVYLLWTAGTTYVMGIAVVWLLRFLGGRWQKMRVIEADVGELP